MTRMLRRLIVRVNDGKFHLHRETAACVSRGPDGAVTRMPTRSPRLWRALASLIVLGSFWTVSLVAPDPANASS